MNPIICAIVNEETHLLHREKRLTANLQSPLYYYEIARYMRHETSEPTWLRDIFSQLGIDTSQTEDLRPLILQRGIPESSYIRATYEITEVCNYKCVHCYMDNKNPASMNYDEKLQMLSVLEKAGVIVLQIGGGELLCSKDFIPFYIEAYKRGFVVQLMTNASLLYKEKYIKTFLKYPPHSISVSIYGATSQTYDKMTQTPGSFDLFMKSLKALSKVKIRVMCNIVLTKFNEHELHEMEEIPNKLGFDHKVYDNIVPGLDGSSDMLALNTDEKIPKNRKPRNRGQNLFSDNHFNCKAGITFLQINSTGEVCLCKTDRNPKIPILEVSLEELCSRMHDYAKKALLLQDNCKACGDKSSCKYCPPLLKLYQTVGAVRRLCNAAQNC